MARKQRKEALEASVAVAISAGVQEEKLLKNRADDMYPENWTH